MDPSGGAARRRAIRETEAEFESWLTERAAYAGFKLQHHVRISKGNIAGIGCEGFPDWVLIREPTRTQRGRLVWCELKRTGEKRTPDQERWGRALLAASQEYYCWWPKDRPEIERVLLQ